MTQLSTVGADLRPQPDNFAAFAEFWATADDPVEPPEGVAGCLSERPNHQLKSYKGEKTKHRSTMLLAANFSRMPFYATANIRDV